MPKRSRSGLVRRPARVVAPTSVNGARSILTERAAGPFADDEVELEILHRRIEDFLDRRIQPVDLVDEEHVARFEIGEERGQVAGLGDHRARGGAEVDAELARDDVRKRGLAEAGRADEQHVVERFAPRPRRRDEHAEIVARLLLADEIRQAAAGATKLASSSRRSARQRGLRRRLVSPVAAPGCICWARDRRSAPPPATIPSAR